jgi:hypothetical protein
MYKCIYEAQHATLKYFYAFLFSLVNYLSENVAMANRTSPFSMY